ncbi:alpha-L-arabinofuranosidase [Bifidobacterium imperatoris]|uniref:non-reducing end alpha-L-arabinofuranosidase n=1 Tax=Bifidobacterium imperatoris TaxID=2020965 RepID=A0A2N5IS65_9BIFI|nr:alpha-L-arabinofuranosidase C-terminal domain-containing protein [Bifidobacterium imperatoris]PLS24808.1 alpha-L-arabinofuranosidase [Bifidobacterium imperatoris]QSY57972.1 alpha-L-arabinofuranosidase [Bifidobacterium imperatoris]
MVRITVSDPTHRTSERLYGVFFEDINHSADGGLNANMVNNYSFDGVYLDHRTWRFSGSDRWRTEADPLRFWHFINCSAESYGTEIRGEHGQILATYCPDPPIHAHSRYARVRATLPAYSCQTDTAGAIRSDESVCIENFGYNGGGSNGNEPAFSIVDGHSYDIDFQLRPVLGRAVLDISVIDEQGNPLTEVARFDCAAAHSVGSSNDVHHDSEDSKDYAGEQSNWVHCRAQVRGTGTDYGILRIAVEPAPRDDTVPNDYTSSDDAPTAADYPTTPIRTGVMFDLDTVQFMDADYWGAGDPKWRYGKLRRDLVETIQALHPTFMRFPGGCIVEGVTPGNEYRWKDTIGALPARRPQYSMWSFKMPDGSSYCQSYQIGFYEYFCLCEDLGAKPLPTLFAGIACQSPGRDPKHMDIDSEAFRHNVVQDYLDLIEFANGNPDTSPWAAVRRDMGHPEPFGLDMIGVGNENFGADYVAKFTRISEAIHERYPHMLCVMSAGLFPFQPAMKRTWDYARTAASTGKGAQDSATGDAIIVDEHSYHSAQWFEAQAYRFDHYPRCGAGVYFGEYSANGYFAGQPQTEQGANTWKSALGEAAFLTGCERNSDVVKMTSYAPLLAHIPAKGWAQNLIEFNPAHVNPTLNYETERMFSTHVGELTYRVDTEKTEEAQHLYVSATGGNKPGNYRYIKIVNTGATAVDVTLEIERGLAVLGSSSNRTGAVHLDIETLAAAPKAKTTIDYRGEAQGAIVPELRKVSLPATNSLMAMKIKPYSLTVVTARWQ